MTLIYFILILGITVTIHEFGHFLFAKKFGIYVYEFSIGMGPRLFKFKRKNDETEYSIRLFPIGGYVQMAGEEIEENSDIPKDKQLQAKPAFQRFLIMVAGVMMNFLLAIVILFFIGLFNDVSFDNVLVTDSTIEGLNDNSRIVSIDGNFVNNYDKLALEMTIVEDQDFVMTVEENNVKKDINVSPIAVGKSGLIYKKDYGFSVQDLIVSSSNIPNVKEGYRIVAVNKIRVDNYSQLLRNLKNAENNVDITFEDEKGNENVINISINKLNDDALSGYNYGFYITGKTERGFLSAIKYAFFKFFSSIEQMIFTIFYLITGKISVSMLSGPVGIYNAVSVYSKYGFSNLLSLLSLICINVGFINILPLPAFDGGHIVFIIIEKIKGSKVNPKIENTIHTVGLILLLILMVIVTYGDITRLF